jgi:hypothetical protein
MKKKKRKLMGDRYGSKTFYDLLKEAGQLHNIKSFDYASDDDPYGNYKFAGMMSKLFDDSADSGFVGRMGEKLYRLANLENSGKQAKNESVEDTEKDLCVLMILWISMRRDRRKGNSKEVEILNTPLNDGQT